MKNRCAAVVHCTVVLTLIAFPLRAQLATTRPINQPASTCSDKLAVTAFSVTPAQTSAGQSVAAKMSFKNLCSSGSLNVPWEIARNDQTIARGVQSLAAGATTQVTAQWTAVAGAHNFYGGVDITFTLNEPSSARANNMTSNISVTVTPRLVTQFLDYEKAKTAGAQFADNVERNLSVLGTEVSTTCSPLGQKSPSSAGSSFPGRENSAALFVADCRNQASGGRATPEVFRSFALKNGWKVKSIEIASQNKKRGDWQWVSTAPAAGSTNPYMKIRIWAEGGPQTDGSVGGIANVMFRVLIEGPEGSNPYQ